MPIYEYRCESCGEKFEEFLSTSDKPAPPCPTCCGQASLRKLVSRFAVKRSDDSRLDDLADPSSFGDFDENDPKSMARWMRKMGKELGEDAGEDFDQMVDELEAGGDDDSDAGSSGDGDDV